jgi:hypothetical protein
VIKFVTYAKGVKSGAGEGSIIIVTTKGGHSFYLEEHNGALIIKADDPCQDLTLTPATSCEMPCVILETK